jgi:hypothetical protein
MFTFENSVPVPGLLHIYHHLQLEETCILGKTDQYCLNSERHVTSIMNNLTRILSVLNNAPLWELSLHVTGLLPKYQGLQEGETIIFEQKVILCWNEGKYVTLITKSCKLESSVFSSIFPLGYRECLSQDYFLSNTTVNWEKHSFLQKSATLLNWRETCNSYNKTI